MHLVTRKIRSAVKPHLLLRASGQLVEVGTDMFLKDLLHRGWLDAQIGRHQRRRARRPVHPCVPNFPRQAEHQRQRPGPLDQLPLQLLEPDAPFLRFQHLVCGLGLQKGRAAAHRRNRQPLFA